MPDRPYINAPPLTEEEMQQLRILLLRYLAYHAAGLVNVAIDGLINRFKKEEPKLVEPPLPELAKPH